MSGTEEDWKEKPWARMKIFSATILSETKRLQIGCLNPKGEFPICSEVSFRIVEKIFWAAKGDFQFSSDLPMKLQHQAAG